MRAAIDKTYGKGITSALEKAGVLRIHATVAEAREALGEKASRLFQSNTDADYVDEKSVESLATEFEELSNKFYFVDALEETHYFYTEEEAYEHYKEELKWVENEAATVDANEEEGVVSVYDSERNEIYRGEKVETEDEDVEYVFGYSDYVDKYHETGMSSYVDFYEDFDELVEAAEEKAEEIRDEFREKIDYDVEEGREEDYPYEDRIRRLVRNEATAKALLERLRNSQKANIRAIKALVDSGLIHINSIDDATLQGVTRWRREVGKIVGSIPKNVGKLTDAAKAVGVNKDQLLAMIRRTLGEETAKQWAARNFFDADALADGTIGEYRIMNALRRGGLQSISGEDHAMSFFRSDIEEKDPEFVKSINRVGMGSGHPPGFGFVLMRYFTDADGKRAVVITETQSDTMSVIFDPDKAGYAESGIGMERLEKLRGILTPIKKTWAKALFRNAIRRLMQDGNVERIYAITPDSLQDDLGADPPESVINDTIGEKSARAEGFGDKVKLGIDDDEIEAWGAIERGSPAWAELAFQSKQDGRQYETGNRLATAQGIFDGKTVHLIAENLSPNEVKGTLLHEFWHKALKAMKLAGDPAYQKLMDRLERIEKLADSPISRGGKVEEWFRKAAERIPEADRSDKVTRLNELAAYAITEYENAPRSLPKTIAKWVRDFLAAIRAFIFEKTGHLPDKLAAADLSAIAQRFLRSATLRENLIVGASPAEVMASQADDGKTPWRRARDWALEKLRRDYKKEKIVPSKDGDAIIVAFSGFDHALNHGVPTLEKTAMALHIEDAIRQAERESVVPDNRGRADPHSTSNYRTDAVIDGTPYNVTIVVRNHSDGNRYYDHFVMEKARQGHSESEAAKAKTPTPPTNGLSLSIEEISIPINDDIRFSLAEVPPSTKGNPPVKARSAITGHPLDRTWASPPI
ncbi:MAG: hypothetical protein LBJ76_00085, partial [Candidatus Accumulibacter sp.]|nr:hypothetical protein [Accumulibacter sp.]